MRMIFITLIFFCQFTSVAAPYSLFEDNGKTGLKNESGQIVIPAVYDALGWSNGTFSVTGKVTGYKLNGNWGIVTVNNERITQADYLSLNPAEGTLLIATKKSSAIAVGTGCINTEGKTIIPFTYAGIKVHALRIVAFVREGNLFKHGLITLDNKALIPFQYKNIYPVGSLRYAVEDFNGKLAIYSDTGKQITGFSIDSLSEFKNNLAIIYENGKQGLINREGQLKSEAKFREIQITPEGIRARMPDEWLVLNVDNKPLETLEADSIAWLNEGRYKIKTASQCYLADKNFKPIGTLQAKNIYPFQNGLAVYKTASGHGVLKRNGNILLKPEFENIVLENAYILTQEKTNSSLYWALRDTTGIKKTSKAYDAIAKQRNGLFPVTRKNYWGVINEHGREVVACVYDSILQMNSDQFAVKFKGQYGIINTKEEWLVYPQTSRVTLLNNDRYFKKTNETLFLMSFDGTVLYFTNNRITLNENNFTEYISSGGTWTIDFDGRIVSRQLPPVESTEKIFPASEGLRGIKRQGRYGFIDDLGRLRVANRYEDLKPFSEGLAAIKIRNKWGFINRDEQIIIQPVYEDAAPFVNGHSIIKQKGLYGYMNNHGIVVLPTRYDAVDVLPTNRLLLTLNNQKGLADEKGNVLLHAKYEYIHDLANGHVIVKQHGKYGLVNLKGLNTIPQVYDYLMYDAENERYLGLRKSQWIEVRN